MLLEYKQLWDHVGTIFIAPTFPAWTTYANEFRQSSAYGLAVLSHLCCTCCFCGQPTSWYFAMIGTRVCRTCFHAAGGPVELCSLAYAEQQLNVPRAELERLPFVRVREPEACRLVATDEDGSCTLVVMRHAQLQMASATRPQRWVD